MVFCYFLIDCTIKWKYIFLLNDGLMQSFKPSFNRNVFCIITGRGLCWHSENLQLTWVLDVVENVMWFGVYIWQGGIFADWVESAVLVMKHIWTLVHHNICCAETFKSRRMILDCCKEQGCSHVQVSNGAG